MAKIRQKFYVQLTPVDDHGVKRTGEHVVVYDTTTERIVQAMRYAGIVRRDRDILAARNPANAEGK